MAKHYKLVRELEAEIAEIKRSPHEQ